MLGDGSKRAALVTLGADGAVLVVGRRSTPIRSPSVVAVDTTGAGDTLNGALAAGLAAGLDLADRRASGGRRRQPRGDPRRRARGDADDAAAVDCGRLALALDPGGALARCGGHLERPVIGDPPCRETASTGLARDRQLAADEERLRPDLRPARDPARTRSRHAGRPRRAPRSADPAGDGRCGPHGSTCGCGPRRSPRRRSRRRSRPAGPSPPAGSSIPTSHGPPSGPGPRATRSPPASSR